MTKIVEFSPSNPAARLTARQGRCKSERGAPSFAPAIMCGLPSMCGIAARTAIAAAER